jgi:hypothetical protein
MAILMSSLESKLLGSSLTLMRMLALTRNIKIKKSQRKRAQVPITYYHPLFKVGAKIDIELYQYEIIVVNLNH